MIYSSLNNGFPLIYSSGEVDFKGIVLQFRVCAEYDTSLLNSIVSEPIEGQLGSVLNTFHEIGHESLLWPGG